MMGVIAATSYDTRTEVTSEITNTASANPDCGWSGGYTTVYVYTNYNDATWGYSIGDVVYSAPNQTNPILGGSNWHNLRRSTNPISGHEFANYQIDNNGVILDIDTCA